MNAYGWMSLGRAIRSRETRKVLQRARDWLTAGLPEQHRTIGFEYTDEAEFLIVVSETRSDGIRCLGEYDKDILRAIDLALDAIEGKRKAGEDETG